MNRIFRLEETRTVVQDWVVRYHNRALQLARQSGYAPAHSTVTVCEWPDGRLAIEYRGRAMPWTEVTGRVTDVVPTPAAVTALRAPEANCGKPSASDGGAASAHVPPRLPALSPRGHFYRVNAGDISNEL